MPPGLEHHAVIHDESVPYRRFVFWITVDYLNRLMEDAREYGYLIQLVQTKGEYIFHHDRIAFNTIQTKVFHLLEEIYSNHFGKAAKVSLCVSDLLLHLNRTVYNERHERSVQEEQQLSERLIDYIEEHLEEELSLDRMVAEFLSVNIILPIFLRIILECQFISMCRKKETGGVQRGNPE